MRVTDKMAYNQVTQNLQKNRSEMGNLQNQAATQKRINKPSDDPIAAARVLSSRTDEKMAKQFLKNIDIARSFLEASDQSLNELTENLMRAKELVLQSANDAGGGEETRRITAQEVEQIHNQAISIANRKLGERYIFGGFRTTKAPFDVAGNYVGDDGDIRIQINKGTFVPMNVTGGKIFLGEGLSSDGTVQARGQTPRDTNELLRHKQEDQQHLQEQNENQDQPNQAMPMRGLASIPSETLRKSPNTGGPGTDYKTSGINVIQSLKDLEIGLRTNDKITVQEGIDNIDQALSQIIQARAAVGSRIGSLNTTADTLSKQIIDYKGTASQLEDADLFEVVSEIQKTESTLKASLDTSGKVIQPSLLDFLK